MLGEIVSLTVLIGAGWGAYQFFAASKLDAHVEAHAGGAELVVKNRRAQTAYLDRIETLSPDAKLSSFDPIPLMVAGLDPWVPPPTREPDKVDALKVRLEVPPDATVRFPFYFFSESRARNCRIALVASESSLIARTKRIVCTISPMATTMVQSSDTP